MMVMVMRGVRWAILTVSAVLKVTSSILISSFPFLQGYSGLGGINTFKGPEGEEEEEEGGGSIIYAFW